MPTSNVTVVLLNNFQSLQDGYMLKIQQGIQARAS